ncbi:conserved hypothetical protein [Hymenobacter roseosalivarius DSM 11622]|uniref:DUF2721 domain-containing protein n=1 Tax=Hymenobacter roseosalivarius DSM 11622 TaxID=645990 RepID=A0A1W1VVL8_9BACT|nr:DUF2721 domain-containing protein [Hymenobacter roseosalivarius]SMB97376.1 conserved hypothetical protein [Hymenobacter roseosalivarius DSM 11622]
MDITLTTPALLFPALSLLLLAYTNRFMALANRVRTLKSQYQTTHSTHLMLQIQNLRQRLAIVRNMQAVGIASMFGCVLCMFLLFAGFVRAGQLVFGASLLALLVSLAMSLREIQISGDALNIELNDMQNDEERRREAAGFSPLQNHSQTE